MREAYRGAKYKYRLEYKLWRAVQDKSADSYVIEIAI